MCSFIIKGYLFAYKGFLGGSVVENPSAFELGRSPRGRNDNPLQYSCLENFIEKPGRLQSMGLQRVRHNWAHTHLHLSCWYEQIPKVVGCRLSTTCYRRKGWENTLHWEERASPVGSPSAHRCRVAEGVGFHALAWCGVSMTPLLGLDPCAHLLKLVGLFSKLYPKRN